MSLKEDLTVLFVSFYSKNIIEKPIGQIDGEIPIIVVENSKDLKLKKHLKKLPMHCGRKILVGFRKKSLMKI